MGIIYDEAVTEEKMYSAYGLTVYGKINRYVSTISGRQENVVISIRIANTEDDILSMNMGNNIIFQNTFNRTIDNFLYWITTENPDQYDIEKQVFESLCRSDCWFNNRIERQKRIDQQKAEDKRRAAERRSAEEKAINIIDEYCTKKQYLCYYRYGEATIVKAETAKGRAEMRKFTEAGHMEDVASFAAKYPDNGEYSIVISDYSTKVADWILGKKGKKI